MSIYTSSNYEIFKTSAAVAISHIIRLNIQLIPLFVEKLMVKNLVSALIEDQPRVQQAFLTIILYMFLSESRFSLQMTEDRQFLANLISSFESSTIVIRAKAVLVCYFTIKTNPKSLIRLSELKLFTILEKLVRDSYKFVQNCMCHLIELLGEVALQGLKNQYEDLKKGLRNNLMQTVLLIVNSTACSLKLPYQALLKTFSEILNLFGSTGSAESLQQVLTVLESLIIHTKCLFSNSEFIISTVLPILLNTRQSQDNDIRFRCLKIFSDILIPFIYEESIYDPTFLSKPSTKSINDLISLMVLPIFSELLQDIDPIPLYSLKLLSAILDRCMAFTTIIKKLKLVPTIIQNFQGGNPKLNLHLISVVKKIIDSHEHSLEELGEIGLIEKVSSVMRVIQEQDWCVDKMLDILYELLCLTAETLKTKRSDYSVLKITEPLCENFVSCTKILSFINEPVTFI